MHAGRALFDTGHPFGAVRDQLSQKNEGDVCAFDPFRAPHDHDGRVKIRLGHRVTTAGRAPRRPPSRVLIPSPLGCG